MTDKEKLVALRMTVLDLLSVTERYQAALVAGRLCDPRLPGVVAQAEDTLLRTVEPKPRRARRTDRKAKR